MTLIRTKVDRRSFLKTSAAASGQVTRSSAPATPKPAALPKAANTQVAATPVAAPAGGGTHFVYLGAFSSADRAQGHWAQVSRANASVLGGMQPRFAKKGELTSVAVGPVSNKKADQICAAVSSGCFKSVAK